MEAIHAAISAQVDSPLARKRIVPSNAITCHKSSRPQSAQSISLVLPAWNEAAALPGAIAEADAALSKIADHYEIIVVDDGSRDATAACVEQIAERNASVKLVRHEINRGYGAALRTGFKAATCDLVVFTDADRQFDLRELDRFALLSQDYQVVCGYRIDRKDSWLRCLYSRVYNLLVRTLLHLGVRDVDCALKMFQRESLQQLEITTDGFLVNSELLLQSRQLNHSLVEVGVTHRPRVEGESTVSPRHIPVVLASLLRLWWNRALFPYVERDNRAGDQGESGKRWAWGQALLLLCAAVMLLYGMSYPLIERDEARYAEIPREMVVTGNWVVPQLNYRTYYDKPALMYWLCAMSYSVFGVHEWAARLVPALCGMLTLSATLWFANRHWGKRVGLLSGLVLFLSVGFLGASRTLLIDGLLTCCSTVALMAAYEAVASGKLRMSWWVVVSVACGFGFLAKGPISLVLLLPPLFAFTWLTRRAAKPRIVHWLMMGAIVTLIAAPWFVMVSLQSPNFATEFFYTHNISRFAGAFHARPIWYFIPVAIVAAHPWSFLGLGFLDSLFSSRQEIREQRGPLTGYLLLSAVWCLTFFSLSKCKLPPYILPAMAPFALMLGRYLDQVLYSHQQSWSLQQARMWAPWTATIATCAAGVGFAIFALATRMESLLAASLFITFWMVVGLLAIIGWRSTQPALVGWGTTVATTMLLSVFVFHRELPRFAHSQAVLGGASSFVTTVVEENQLSVITLGLEWSSVPFDSRRNDVHNLSSLDEVQLDQLAGDQREVLVVTRRAQSFEEQFGNLPSWAHATTICERGPARLVMIKVDPQHADASTAAKGDASRR